MDESILLVERHERVALVRLNRPHVRNALSFEVRGQLHIVLEELNADESVHVIVITGSDDAFAAGADVNAIKNWNYNDAVYSTELRGAWKQLLKCRKPIIAAVAGVAFGAGCELAMMCDFIISADNAQFGQPEIRLGIIPGSGGTQRLTRLVGKSKAMEMVLTGRAIDSAEAERCGLVARVVPLADLVPEALRTAAQIARYSAPVVQLAKEAVNLALETPLSDGLQREARLFEATFRTFDAHEGMVAFLEKRKPNFIHR